MRTYLYNWNILCACLLFWFREKHASWWVAVMFVSDTWESGVPPCWFSVMGTHTQMLLAISSHSPISFPKLIYLPFLPGGIFITVASGHLPAYSCCDNTTNNSVCSLLAPPGIGTTPSQNRSSLCCFYILWALWLVFFLLSIIQVFSRVSRSPWVVPFVFSTTKYLFLYVSKSCLWMWNRRRKLYNVFGLPSWNRTQEKL